MSERITLAQLAAISMLTERTLRSYLKRGLLAGEKTPGGWRFTAEQTAAFLALPQVCSASNARRNAGAEDFIQRRMDTTGQLCAVLDLPVAAAELCRTVAALAAEHGVTMAFHGDAVRYATLPSGHPLGWADALRSAVREYYNDVKGVSACNYATFADGDYIERIVEACVKSSREDKWVDVM